MFFVDTNETIGAFDDTLLTGEIRDLAYGIRVG